MTDSVRVEVLLDRAAFRRFATFDTLFRRARWLTVGGFALLMVVFALVCFFTDRALVGGVILASGIIIPAVYLGQFFASVRAQQKKFGLDRPRHVYTLELSDKPTGIHVENPEGQQADYPWDGNVSLYRVKGALYLYVMAGRAFLLPEEQIPGGGDPVWAVASKYLHGKQLQDRRGRK